MLEKLTQFFSDWTGPSRWINILTILIVLFVLLSIISIFSQSKLTTEKFRIHSVATVCVDRICLIDSHNVYHCFAFDTQYKLNLGIRKTVTGRDMVVIVPITPCR